ncbi:DUF3291 domain-containing protein [Phenylobacterium terrae]|uniref:DUF3291 domain-containing protein n=1 Tax=Phenylobacterium terrae TaxID=2665495 RepID=A0ABW4MWT7_9CAUL
MAGHHLAQINIARLKAPFDAPETAEFVANLGRINALAEAAPGFVWRPVDEPPEVPPAFEDPMLVANLSVWEDLESLAAFVYRSGHRDVMRRRREWFVDTPVYMALWWVRAGHRPRESEGKARLELLAQIGPTPEAFTFRYPFPAPGAADTPLPMPDRCA